MSLAIHQDTLIHKQGPEFNPHQSQICLKNVRLSSKPTLAISLQDVSFSHHGIFAVRFQTAAGKHLKYTAPVL